MYSSFAVSVMLVDLSMLRSQTRVRGFHSQVLLICSLLITVSLGANIAVVYHSCCCNPKC